MTNLPSDLILLGWTRRGSQLFAPGAGMQDAKRPKPKKKAPGVVQEVMGI